MGCTFTPYPFGSGIFSGDFPVKVPIDRVRSIYYVLLKDEYALMVLLFAKTEFLRSLMTTLPLD